MAGHSLTLLATGDFLLHLLLMSAFLQEPPTLLHREAQFTRYEYYCGLLGKAKRIHTLLYDLTRNSIVNNFFTGKSFSEALILGSTNPQHDRRLSIDLRVQYMKIPSSEHGENMGRTCKQHVLFMFSPCSEFGIFMY